MFGVAVLASIFASYGGYGTGQSFTDGLVPALWVAAAAVLALTIPVRRRRQEVPVARLEPALGEAA